MTDPYVGEIALFPYDFAPRDWLRCEGYELKIQMYQALFSLIGTTYGGDGKTTFRIPDLRGRVVMGYGPSQPLGTYGGLERVQLAPGNIPTHTHSFRAYSVSGVTGSPEGNYLGRVVESGTTSEKSLYAAYTAADSGKLRALNPGIVGVVGGGATARAAEEGGELECEPPVPGDTDLRLPHHRDPFHHHDPHHHPHGHPPRPPTGPNLGVGHSNMQPFLALTYCIALYGTYPQRAMARSSPPIPQDPPGKPHGKPGPSVETE